MRKLTSTLVAASASLFLCAMPAWAGHDHGKSHHSGTSVNKRAGGHHGGKGGKGSVTDAGESSDTDSDASTRPGSNKEGAERGLERADQAAGEHGEAGRTKAAGHGKH
jgi:hypothetical protein